MWEVGDILKLDVLERTEKIHLVYHSQSDKGKFRAMVLDSNVIWRQGQCHWFEKAELDKAKKVGYNKVIPPTFEVGDKVKVVGGCCGVDNNWHKEAEVTHLWDAKKYKHKLHVRIKDWGHEKLCIWCIRPLQPQIKMFKEV